MLLSFLGEHEAHPSLSTQGVTSWPKRSFSPLPSWAWLAPLLLILVAPTPKVATLTIRQAPTIAIEEIKHGYPQGAGDIPLFKFIEVLMRFVKLLLMIVFIISFGKALGAGLEVSKSEFGDSWPFTVEGGVVDCVDGQAAVFKVEGKTYQLNGFARSRGYAPIDPIWKDNPDIPGTKISIGEMIRVALDRC